MNYKTLQDIGNIDGVPVVARLDLNVPVQNGEVVEDYRIRKALPTIKFLQNKGAKVIILSHIEGGTDSLKPIFERLKKDIPNVSFCENCIEDGHGAAKHMKAGDVMLCENLRLYDGEKKNDEAFAKKLASLGKVYVNDGFSVSHRKHASIVGIPKFLPGYLGLQFEQEIEHLSKSFNPPHPFVFILGGAKFDTKLPLIEKFLTIADTVIVAGAVANDLFRAKGVQIGASRASDMHMDLSKYTSNPKILLPKDVIVESDHEQRLTKQVTDVAPHEKIFDAGPETVELFGTVIKKAEFVLWNGPLGNYENGYTEPTKKLAGIISASDAHSIVGGGDTLAAIAALGIEDEFDFVSTGGGAMLDFLVQGTLPGLDALKEKK